MPFPDRDDRRQGNKPDDKRNHGARLSIDRKPAGGDDAENNRRTVNDRQQSSPVDTQIDKAMVNVFPIGGVNRLAATESPEYRENRVHDRYVEQRQDGDDRQGRKNRHGAVGALEAEEGQHRKQEPQGQRSAVSHEDPRRRHIVHEKARQAPHESRGKQRRQRRPLPDRDQTHKERDDQSHATGKTVGAVNEVYRVGYGDDPEHRCRDRDPGRNRKNAVPREIDRRDGGAGERNEDARDDLDRQFEWCPQINKIVVESQTVHDHEPRPQEQDRSVPLPRGEDRPADKDDTESARQEKRQEDPDAAEARGIAGMNLTRVVMVVPIVPMRQHENERNNKCVDDERRQSYSGKAGGNLKPP